MRSASVPCGLNSSSSSFERNWRSNSLFSPTYDDTILRIWRVSSSSPRPKPSTPALLEITVRSRAPLSRSARIRFSGMPHSPNPPDITDMPSLVRPASADFASAKTLPARFISGRIDLLRGMRGGERRHLAAGLPDEVQARVAGRLDAEALRSVHLRHEAAIGHGRRIAVREHARQSVAREDRVVRIESAPDPLAHPLGDG